MGFLNEWLQVQTMELKQNKYDTSYSHGKAGQELLQNSPEIKQSQITYEKESKVTFHRYNWQQSCLG